MPCGPGEVKAALRPLLVLLELLPSRVVGANGPHIDVLYVIVPWIGVMDSV